MAQVLIDSSLGNYGVAYSDAVNQLAGGYVSRDLSGFAKNCEPTYGNANKSVGATTYVDGERSIAIDRDPVETKEFTALLEECRKNPTEANRAKLYQPKYAYHLRQRTKFTPYTTEISVLFNDEAEFFALCAQGAGDVKTAANTMIHNRNKAFIKALCAPEVLRQQTDGYGVSTDNDTADTLPDICKTTYGSETEPTVDHLLEVAGKIDEIEDWTGPRLALVHPKWKSQFLRFNLETVANALFVPGNDVICARQFEGYAGFTFMTSQYVDPGFVLIFEPGAAVGRVHWFDRVKGGKTRETKWQQELLYQSCEQFKRIDDFRVHIVEYSALAVTPLDNGWNSAPFREVGAVVK